MRCPTFLLGSPGHLSAHGDKETVRRGQNPVEIMTLRRIRPQKPVTRHVHDKKFRGSQISIT